LCSLAATKPPASFPVVVTILKDYTMLLSLVDATGRDTYTLEPTEIMGFSTGTFKKVNVGGPAGAPLS
jgi:hypothetical protein